MENKGLIILGFILYISLSTSIDNLKKQVGQINRKLDMLLDEKGLDFKNIKISDELRSELEGLVNENSRVKAVKRLREETNMDLVEAKEYIDNNF